MYETKKTKHRIDIFGDRLRQRGPQLSAGLQAVLYYINQHRAGVLESTALEIAAACNTSDATVVRSVQALGFAGLRDLKKTLRLWFEPVPDSTDKMSSTVNEFSSDINSGIDFVLEGHRRTCDVLSTTENRAAISTAVALLLEARQVAIFGINASGILAEYTARLFNRIGLPCMPLNRAGVGLAEQLLTLQRGDVLIMMAQKSAHREGMTTLREARRLGNPVILLTNAPDSRFAEAADVVIRVPRGGENGKVPLHGTVLVCLEMLVLAVASSASQRTIKSMKRMQELHRGLKPGSHKR
ncbi:MULTISPECIES: MurR/RpiR family transcriptional regulator [Tatumella]|uniref:MurR/RpiR family transcriptional regulator n=1 Tax=Tatumella punctata TaxID=399969 RepID=A0ABW1VUG3_9GAMM|nr:MULTISPECIES: MurR/RpiR family transcriptional regulator [unclassified Tatumella]MBS0857541.1 MurR/RpiR family transcriptional regulator [Tatumella sp. JGM16]MBS0878369.1 MurR/RpiR family transcriptional regulator [Tatumella sp. JGM82]MBS0891165.1 MurR/RpiR family transcriptional regulator [Tatumella sp. JGM94]MBS0894799.1 MurR/RpiR family transcriptional regulator [Tatumella sp. JGM130]MBS0902722.1 MurR/RpiR family transcriptional regulator [Tatumella sp. JGM100]